MDRRLRGRSVKGAGGVGHEDLNSHRPRELGAQHWAAVAGWGYRVDSSWRSLISSELNQRCIHRFTIHNLQYTTSPTRLSSPSLLAEPAGLAEAVVVLVPHQMDTRRRCDDGLVICTQSVAHLSRTPVPGLSDHNLMFTSLPRHSVCQPAPPGDMMSQGHVLGTRWHSITTVLVPCLSARLPVCLKEVGPHTRRRLANTGQGLSLPRLRPCR